LSASLSLIISFEFLKSTNFTNTLKITVHDSSAVTVRQIEIHTAEPLVPDPSPFEVENAIAKLKRFKSTGSDQIPAELIQAGGEILGSKIHKLIKSIWNKEELPDQWKKASAP
jgi:hypothetical protein